MNQLQGIQGKLSCKENMDDFSRIDLKETARE
jgi:hypothetical protein